MFAKLTDEREYLRALITVAIYAGPRRGELLKLHWSNVDVAPNLINFTETKTNATDQGKRGAIVVWSEYRQKQRHKFVTKRRTAGR